MKGCVMGYPQPATAANLLFSFLFSYFLAGYSIEFSK